MTTEISVMYGSEKVKRADVVVNKYAPCLKCVMDDYKNVMLF